MKPVPVDRDGVGPGLGPVGRADGGDRGRDVVGVRVGQRRRGPTTGGRDGHRDGAGPRRDDHAERGGVGHVDRGAGVGAELDAGRARDEPGAGERDGVVPAWGPLFGLTLVTVGGAL